MTLASPTKVCLSSYRCLHSASTAYYLSALADSTTVAAGEHQVHNSPVLFIYRVFSPASIAQSVGPTVGSHSCRSLNSSGLCSWRAPLTSSSVTVVTGSPLARVCVSATLCARHPQQCISISMIMPRSMYCCKIILL